jgi:hypothetical protein
VLLQGEGLDGVQNAFTNKLEEFSVLHLHRRCKASSVEWQRLHIKDLHGERIGMDIQRKTPSLHNPITAQPHRCRLNSTVHPMHSMALADKGYSDLPAAPCHASQL